jgi:hypothetical protein
MLFLELFFLALLLSLTALFASCVNSAYCRGDDTWEGLDSSCVPTGKGRKAE